MIMNVDTCCILTIRYLLFWLEIKVEMNFHSVSLELLVVRPPAASTATQGLCYQVLLRYRRDVQSFPNRDIDN